jgi:hypothetical protein
MEMTVFGDHRRKGIAPSNGHCSAHVKRVKWNLLERGETGNFLRFRKFGQVGKFEENLRIRN